MKPQYQHNVTTSFALWLDHYLLDKGEAYSNQTGRFVYYSDPRLSSTYKPFGSKYKQWVFDSSITGATIPTGFYVNSVFKSRDDGLKIDFLNGRVLASGVSTGAAVTGSFAVKEFNVYLSNDSEDDLILENNLEANKKFPWTGAYLDPYDQVFPAVYVCPDNIDNKPFSFGGEDETTAYIKCVVFAESPYSLEGVMSLFADSKQKVFKEKDFTSYPLNEYGDIKTAPYSFDDYYLNPDTNSELFIKDVTVSKFKDRRASAGAARSYIGFMDFEITKYRYPRA